MRRILLALVLTLAAGPFAGGSRRGRLTRGPDEPVVDPGEGEELPAAHDGTRGPRLPHQIGHGAHTGRVSRAAWEPPPDRHRLHQRARTGEAHRATGRRARRPDPAPGTVPVSHGIRGNDHATIDAHTRSLYISCKESYTSWLQAFYYTERTRGEPRDHGVHRRSDQPGDGGNRGRPGGRDRAVSGP